MSTETVFTLEDAASSVEAMAANWYRDLVNGTDAAVGLTPHLRATLAFVTREPAEEHGRQVLRLEREREEEQQRQDEEARQRVLAAQESMLKELRRLMAEAQSTGPLNATTIADAVVRNWMLFVDFFQQQSFGLFAWLEGSGDSGVVKRVRAAMAAGEQPPRPERLMAGFCIAFATNPAPRYRGRAVDCAALAEFARGVVAQGLDNTDVDDAVFLASLLESGVLTIFARLEGHADLEILERRWGTWVDEWRTAQPKPEGYSLAWGRAVLLHAAADTDALARLSSEAHDATAFPGMTSAPRHLLDRVGESPGIDMAILEAVLREREAATARLERSLHGAGLLAEYRLVVPADLGHAFASDADKIQRWIARSSNFGLMRYFLIAHHASDAAIEALERLAVKAEAAPRSHADRAIADVALFALTVALCPGETPKFDGSRVDVDALADFAFGSSSWHTIDQAIQRIPRRSVANASPYAVTRLYKSRILARDITGISHPSTKTTDSRWRLAHEEFIAAIRRVADVSGHPFSALIGGEGAWELVLGILLTATVVPSTRDELARAARTAFARRPWSHRKWFAGMKAGASVGVDLAFCVLGGFTNALPAMHTQTVAETRRQQEERLEEYARGPHEAAREVHYESRAQLWWALGVIAVTFILIVVLPIMVILWLLLGLAGLCLTPLFSDL